MSLLCHAKWEESQVDHVHSCGRDRDHERVHRCLLPDCQAEWRAFRPQFEPHELTLQMARVGIVQSVATGPRDDDLVVYGKIIYPDWVPHPGDAVVLFEMPPTGAGLMLNQVDYRVFDLDSRLMVHLRRVYVDPSPGWVAAHVDLQDDLWYTEEGGDLGERLEAGGWERIEGDWVWGSGD